MTTFILAFTFGVGVLVGIGVGLALGLVVDAIAKRDMRWRVR